MNKSLEALEVIECILSNHQTMLEAKDKRFEFINTIKQDLKRLEELEKENLELKERNSFIKTVNKNALNEMRNLIDEKHKLKNVIEILKDSLHLGIDFYDYDYDYKFVVKVGGLFEHISSEEYELLKEVLKDE